MTATDIMLLCIQVHHHKSSENLHPHQMMAGRKINTVTTALPSAHTAPRCVAQGAQQDPVRRFVWFEYIHKVNVRRQPTCTWLWTIKVTVHLCDQTSSSFSTSRANQSPTHSRPVLGLLRRQAERQKVFRSNHLMGRSAYNYHH